MTLSITLAGHTRCTADNWAGNGEWSDVGKLYAPMAGRGWLAVDGNRSVLRPRQLYLIPPHHRLTFAAEPELTVDWLHFLAHSPVLDAQLAGLGRVIALPREVAARWRPVTAALGRWQTQPAPSLLCRIQALVLDVIGLVLGDLPPQDPQAVAGWERLLPAIRFMDDHVTAPPPLAAIAGRVNLSPEHFHRCFRAIYGTTPFAYMQRRRMARAHQRLVEGVASVKEVAAGCGYDDPYYFSRVFRRQYGCSPRAVRLGRVRQMP